MWGNNKAGNLGIGGSEPQINPDSSVRLSFKKYVVKVAMGSHHSVFLTNSMEAYVMGENNKGQLGLGTHEINKSTYPTLL